MNNVKPCRILSSNHRHSLITPVTFKSIHKETDCQESRTQVMISCCIQSSTHQNKSFSGPHRAYPLIFAPMYTSCISGWYFIFIISCVISHSSIKNNFEYTPQLKAGTLFAVPIPSSGTHTTGGIQPDGVYH